MRSSTFISWIIFVLLAAAGASYGGSRAVQRQIQFAGLTWNVKNGGPWGPGPNLWSDDPQSVWLDDQGRLHLAIRKAGNNWYCAEVYTDQYTTYGEHRFLVEGYVDRMDKNIVLGLFVYASDTAEIDVEYAKWGDPYADEVGSFTVQPYTTDGNQHSFPSPLSDPYTTHWFNWQPDSVVFASIQGHYYNVPSDTGDYIERWSYYGEDTPSDSDSLRIHINFWLMNGLPPQDLSILEVIITDVVHPLSPSSLDHGSGKRPPAGFELAQNYPNPFNPITTIRYRLPALSEVERPALSEVEGPVFSQVNLSIYNVLGQKIRTLVNTTQRAGTYRITFDAAGLTSGVYFYRLQAGDFTAIRKMILIR